MSLFKNVFITSILLTSLVSLGAVVCLHLDGSAGEGHIHAEGTMLDPGIPKSLHTSKAPEKVVALFITLPVLVPGEDSSHSFDEALNLSSRAPPA